MRASLCWSVVGAVAIGLAAVWFLDQPHAAPNPPVRAAKGITPRPTFAAAPDPTAGGEAISVSVSVAASSAVAASTSTAAAAAPMPPPLADPSKPEVPIQDGKTIDFSSGAAVIKDSPEEKAALEQSLRDMDAAAASVKFSRQPAK